MEESKESPINGLSSSTRWKWMAGATAASAAATGAAHASTVQITQLNNLYSDSVDTLTADFTGDTNPTGTLTGAPVSNTFYGTVGSNNFKFYNYGVRLFTSVTSVGLARVQYAVATANPSIYATSYYVAVGQAFSNKSASTSPTTVNGLVPIEFNDARINGNAPTSGFLDIRAFNTGFYNHTIQIVRLVFDDASTAEPGGVTPGGTDPEWVDPTPPPVTPPATIADPNAALKASLANKIKKLKKKLKKLKSSGNSAKAKKLKAKIKKLGKKLKSL